MGINDVGEQPRDPIGVLTGVLKREEAPGAQEQLDQQKTQTVIVGGKQGRGGDSIPHQAEPTKEGERSWGGYFRLGIGFLGNGMPELREDDIPEGLGGNPGKHGVGFNGSLGVEKLFGDTRGISLQVGFRAGYEYFRTRRSVGIDGGKTPSVVFNNSAASFGPEARLLFRLGQESNLWIGPEFDFLWMKCFGGDIDAGPSTFGRTLKDLPLQDSWRIEAGATAVYQFSKHVGLFGRAFYSHSNIAVDNAPMGTSTSNGGGLEGGLIIRF